VLALIIDAADNAELVAAEYSDKCFVKALLRETIPAGCKLVAICRTERIHYLDPQSSVNRILLRPFSVQETGLHFRRFHPNASNADVLEFHRLTAGNPRVQANALSQPGASVEAVLSNLGPAGSTVEAQIHIQLQNAVSRIRDASGRKVSDQVEAICLGLANLPPFIPLDVLAKAAEVDVSTIKSFVSDLGRPLWHSDDSVQFRDEPTEKWFRDQFAASVTQIDKYVNILKPLANSSAYVAKSLPQLLLASENYQGLIDLALSDDCLPTSNPIDERNIRVYRLQFAFKAALKLNRLYDAARLAIRAGEEVAGDKRQLELLAKNSDLIPRFQDAHHVQELVYRQKLRGRWPGSENIYAAALLSSVSDFHGEARSYLRAAQKWLQIYFEDLRKNPPPREARGHPGALTDTDLVELAWAHYNLFGPEAAARSLLSWKPKIAVFRLTRQFVCRLIDFGRFEDIEVMSKAGAMSNYFTIAIADGLISVARLPSKESLRNSLKLMNLKTSRVERPPEHDFQDIVTPAIVSFAEA
jgi:hypothetical protein